MFLYVSVCVCLRLFTQPTLLFVVVISSLKATGKGYHHHKKINVKRNHTDIRWKMHCYLPLNVYHTTWPLYRLHCPKSRQVNKVRVVFVARYKLLRRKEEKIMNIMWFLWIFVCFIYSLLLWLYVGIGGNSKPKMCTVNFVLFLWVIQWTEGERNR